MNYYIDETASNGINSIIYSVKYRNIPEHIRAYKLEEVSGNSGFLCNKVTVRLDDNNKTLRIRTYDYGIDGRASHKKTRDMILQLSSDEYDYYYLLPSYSIFATVNRKYINI